jgi:hypothetical protein
MIEKPLDTDDMVLLTGVMSALGWLLTIISGYFLYSKLSLGLLVIVISIGWLVPTVGVSYYMKQKQKGSILSTRVWKSWLVLSFAGLIVNIISGISVEVLEFSGPTISSVPMEFGVILPWLIVYAIGGLFTSLYNLDNKQAISNRQRAVYGIIGIISAAGGVVLALNPKLHAPMILLLIVLSLIQVVTISKRL